MMANTAAAPVVEPEYSRSRISVWWDIENCPVPKGCDAHGIAQKLSLALMNMNYCGPLSISSYGNTNLIPNSVQQALSSTGISLNHVPSGRKDASDKKILVDMFLWVVENPAPANLMLISGDGDFSDALHRLRMKRYNILLAHPQQVSASLVSSAKATWLWRSLLISDCPLTQCESSGLVDNGLYPSDSDISSQVVSEQVLSKHPMDSLSGSSRDVGNKLKGIYVPKASNQLLQQETKRKKLQKNCSETGESAWFCNICNVACKSFVIFTTHLSSKEHAAQWEMKQNLELFGEPENMAATPSKCHEKDVEMTNKVVEAGVEAIAHCGLCSVVCPGQTSLDSYPKNSTMVKKQAEQALVDAKNIEESVQDSELQSPGAQESMKCLEKQNKELTEPCTTSEMSGREFWQDFKEEMESDGVAPLNVDCVFSRVPKELRECFDSILKKPEPSENEIVIEKLKGMLKHGLEIKSGEPKNAEPYVCRRRRRGKKKKSTVIEDGAEPYVCRRRRRGKKKKSTVIEDGAEPYVCRLCSVICDCPAFFESHLKGRKHAATIKKHTEALLDDKKIQEEIIRDINGHPKALIEELRERCSPSERNVEELFQTFDGLENGNNSIPKVEFIFTELNPDFLAPEEASEWFNAIIKKQEVSQDANITQELESIPNPESNSAGSSEHSEEYMDKKREKVTKDETEAYVCSICSVISDCPIVFESHLMGRRHAARVKKHAEVLFDDKKIQEESQPKEAKESIKEVFQSTKGVDSEIEQIPSAEFPEPKEAREQPDSIIKRLQITTSLEDTSNQAENASERAEERMKNGAAATEIWVCDWCNVMCPSQIDFDSHLTGKKHAATVKKQAATVKKQAATVKKQAATVKKQAAVMKNQAGTKFKYIIKSGP